MEYNYSSQIRLILSDIFKEAIAERAFPGGVVWLANPTGIVAHEAFGTKTYEAVDGAAWSGLVERNTIYDIASLSKLFTATAFLIAARAAGVQVEAPLTRFLPQFATTDKQAITLRQLLNHSSGIEIAIQSFTKTPTIEGPVASLHRGFVPTEQWVERIAAARLKTPPGESVLYSCTNYFLLARVTEMLSGERLDKFISHEIFEPLGMQRTSFTPLEDFPARAIAPTEIYVGTNEPWHGVVHDEAARTWQQETGGACGNAGVFATAEDLSRFTQLWLDAGQGNGCQILHAEDVHQAFNDTVPEDDIRRGWCWQIDAYGYMSETAPPHSAGHTGFTGPTLWLNPPTRHVAIILENRVYPTRNGPNRMGYHRRIAEWLLEQPV
ncbi:MAG: beta-lactamase family protein [Abitibacteriaceae bacterium]|nr:beta-lactamase family protein [Abditibacteriaceae bacterium]